MKRSLTVILLLCMMFAVLCCGCADTAQTQDGQQATDLQPPAAKADSSRAPGMSLEDYNSEDVTIGVPTGAAAMDAAQARFPNAEIKYYNIDSDGYLAVITGAIDAYAHDTILLKYASDGSDELRMLDETFGDTDISIGISRKCSELKEPIDLFIQELIDSGMRDDMLERWIADAENAMPELASPISPDKTVRVGTSGVVTPMTYYGADGKLTGFDIELLQRLALSMNAELEISVMNYDALVAGLESGKLDIVVANLNITPERAELIDYSIPYMTAYSGLVVKQDGNEAAAETANALPDPATARIGAQTATSFEAMAMERFPDADYSSFTSLSSCMLSLKSGQIDYAVSANLDALYYKEVDSNYCIAEPPLTEIKVCAAISKDKPELVAKVDELLLKYEEDGTLKRMYSNWYEVEGHNYIQEQVPILDQGEVLNVVINSNNEPNAFIQDGVLCGYDIELVYRLACDMGMRVEFIDVEIAAMVPTLASGRGDMVLCGLVWTEERAEKVLFSRPYITLSTVLVYYDSTAETANALPDPATARIGAQTATSFEAMAMERFPDADYSSFTSLSGCMLSLKSGQIDYAVSANLDALYYKEVDSNYCIAEPPLTEIKVCAAISKDKPELVAKVDELLLKYEEDGTLKRMYSNWYEVEGHNYIQEQVPILDQGEVLNVVINSNNEPNAFIQDGVLCGYDIELVYRLAYDMGMRVEFIDVEIAAMVPTLASGRGDMVLCGLVWTEERAEKVLFSRPYITLSTVLVYYDAAQSGAASAAADSDSFWTSLAASFRKNFIVENRWMLLVRGIGTTLLLSVFSGLVGIIIGFGFCLLRMTRRKVLCSSVKVITRILQGTPIVVLLMILYYVVFNKTGLDGVAVSVVAFGLSFGAYASEIMLSGINAVDRGQSEAAAAIGFSSSQTFIKIVFPQAARHFLPVLKGEYISLVKMTSIVGYVAVQDLTKVSDIIRSRTYEAFFPLIVTAIIYFALSFGLSSLLSLIEVRIDPKRRARTLKGVELQ